VEDVFVNLSFGHQHVLARLLFLMFAISFCRSLPNLFGTLVYCTMCHYRYVFLLLLISGGENNTFPLLILVFDYFDIVP
jgi:hypothetical protein